MKTTLTAVALALSLGLAGVASPVDAQSGGYRGGPPPGGGGGGGYRGGPPQGGGYRGAPPPGRYYGGGWRGPGYGWGAWGRPWGPAWRPGWGWGGWGWNGWGWGSGWGWGVGWNPGWGWGPGVWGWGVGAPIVVAPPVSVWAPPLGPTVYVEREGTNAEVLPPAAAPSTQQWWYWCASAHGYYPYVGACPEGWQRVAPQVPAGPQ